MSFFQKLTTIFSKKTHELSTAISKPSQPVAPLQHIAPKAKPSKQISQKELAKAKHLAEQYLQDAKVKAREILIEAKDEAFKFKQASEDEFKSKRQEIEQLQQQLYKTQADVDRRLGSVEERERTIEKLQKQLEEKFAEVEKIKQDQLEKLERAASLTREEAKKLILEAVEKKTKNEIGRIVKESEDEAHEQAEEKAREIIVEAMRHGATDYVAEYTVSAVKISDEEIKGRVIGREGRNIRAFEQATGVDVDLDEEGAIRLSCFDSVRREIAKVSLEKLIRDGRIQPARIEEVVNKTREELERVMYKEGENLCHQVKVYNLPREIIQMLGRFKYRYSYGQNMITHTLEETKIGMMMNQTYALTRELLHEKDVPAEPAGVGGDKAVDEKAVIKMCILYLRQMADAELDGAEKSIAKMKIYKRTALRVLASMARAERPEPELSDIPDKILQGLIHDAEAKLSS